MRRLNGWMRRVVVMPAGVLVAFGSLEAQTSGGEPTTELTLQEALERAVATSPAYRQALNRMDLAGPQARQAWGGFLPNLNLSYGTNQNFRRETTAIDFFGNPIENPTTETVFSSQSSQSASLGIDLFQGGRRFHQVGQARAEAEVTRRAGERELNGVLAQVQRQFLEAQMQKALLEVEGELLAARERDLLLTTRLFELANKNRADVLGIEVEVEQQRSAMRRAEGDYRKALLALQTAVGDTEVRTMTVAGGAPSSFDPSVLDLEGLVAGAVVSSPRVLEATAATRSRRSQLDMNRSSRWPTVSLGSRIYRSSFAREQEALFDFSPNDFGGDIQLSVSIPIFQRFETSYQIAQASVEHRNAVETERLTELQVEEEVRGRFVDLETAWYTLQDGTRSQELADERLRLVREEYRLANATFEDLQGAVRTAAEARRTAVEQRYAFARALVDLYEAAGVVAQEAGLTDRRSRRRLGELRVSLPRLSTSRPVAVAMLFLAITLLGGISFARLPIDLLPDVSYPRLVVYTGYPDVAPAEVERLVTELVEAQAAAVPGVEDVTSVSREGVSLVTLQFAWGTDMDFAMLNVRERLDNIREALPETSERPTILRVDPQSQPILTVSLSGGNDLWQTKEIGETVFRRRLEQLDGVAQATVTGGLDREIQVEVDPGLLESYGLTLAEVVQALDAANYSAPGGTILRGRYRYPLRTLGEFQTVDEIGEVVVGRQQIGGEAGAEGAGYRLVRLNDIGRVVDGFAEREAVARYDGHESVGLLVFKEAGANTVRVAEDVEATLELLRQQYPGVTAEIASNQATFISESISNVVQALVLGGLLAFVVLFLFLRDPRYPVAVATAIPISVVGAFALMEAFDVSLNIMSLGGLALGVGMLVDNSIVVLENIFRHRELGVGMFEAAAKGAEEVQGAITASTLTTISVFGPIIYVEGVAGELFGALSLTVAFSLLASLVVALTLLPTMAARFGGRNAPAPAPEPPVASPETPPTGRMRRVVRGIGAAFYLPVRIVRGAVSVARQLFSFWGAGVAAVGRRVFGPALQAFDRAFNRFAEWYHRRLERALARRTLVLGGAGLSLVAAGLVAALLSRDLLPEVDQGAFDVRVELPEGTALAATAAAVADIEAELLQDPAIEAVFSRIGRDVQAYDEGDEASGVNTAVIQVRLDSDADTEEVLARSRAVESRFPAGSLAFETGQATALGQMLGGTQADIAVRVQGEELTAAYAFAEQLRDRLGAVDRIRNVRIGSERGQPQFQVEIDRTAAARYGIEPRVVAETIERAMRGDRATEFVDFDRKIGVLVRLPDDLRYDTGTLDYLRINGVPLRELVQVHETVGPAEIRREDQARVITVYADVAGGGLADAISAVELSIADLPLPADLRVSVGGENEEMRRSFRDLAFAFGLALLLVYMILAAQFESFIHPFTILISVPLALVGAVFALALAGQGLNTMSLIGAVILVGIVVNDAIVKVDFINQSRARGNSVRDAILEAGEFRLRPIVMTTVTTVLGLLPMALGIGRGADLRAPLAIAVIGGLIFATALTLIVVPVVYATVEDVRRFFTGRAPVPSGAPVPGGSVS